MDHDTLLLQSVRALSEEHAATILKNTEGPFESLSEFGEYFARRSGEIHEVGDKLAPFVDWTAYGASLLKSDYREIKLSESCRYYVDAQTLVWLDVE